MAAALRFDRRALQGAALVGVVLGAYLTIATDFSAVVQAADYAGSIPSDVPLVNEVQFATILAVFAFSFAVLAITPLRRAIALTSVPLVLLGWAFLGVERADGVLPLGDAAAWSVLLDQGFITLIVALGGWLIARGWHPLSWPGLLVALLPPLAGRVLDAANLDATAHTLVIQAVVIVAGAGAAVGARAIDRALRRAADSIEPGDRGIRYGLSLGLVVAATYLAIATDFSGYLQQTSFAGSASVSLLGMLQFLLLLVLFVTSMAVMPASADQRLAAITYVAVLLLLWATFGIERSVGNIRDPVALWFFLLDQGFVTMVVALGGWLIVRGKHPLSAAVLVLAIIPPIVARSLVDASVTSGAYTLAIEGIVVLGSVAGGMLAWLIDAAVHGRVRGRLRGGARAWLERRRTVGRPVAVADAGESARTRPRAVTIVAIVVWIGGALQVLGGVQSFADQSAAGEAQRAIDLVAALLTVGIGVVTIVVGVQLLRASRVARVIVTVFVALQLFVAALLLLVTLVAGDPMAAILAGVAVAVDVTAIVMLWAGSAARFFRRDARQPS